MLDHTLFPLSHCRSYERIGDPPVAEPIKAVRSITRLFLSVAEFLRGATGGLIGTFSTRPPTWLAFEIVEEPIAFIARTFA